MNDLVVVVPRKAPAQWTANRQYMSSLCVGLLKGKQRFSGTGTPAVPCGLEGSLGGGGDAADDAELLRFNWTTAYCDRNKHMDAVD